MRTKAVAITGGIIAAWVVGVYAFTIKTMGQEDFSDVKVPEQYRDPEFRSKTPEAAEKEKKETF